MRSARNQPSLVASPIFVGALTVLVVVIAVFLAYGANSGLPFVPTYQIKVVTTDAAELVRGNDVRIGGARVGQVKTLTAQVAPDGTPTAVLDLALDRSVQPLPVDSQFAVRQRSNLGLKYLELIPGSSKQGVPPGGSLDTTHGRPVVDLNDLLDTFNSRTRNAVRGAVGSVGDAIAGRGSGLNDAVGALNPLFTHLTPVARNLNDPATGLGFTIRAFAAAVNGIQPVAPQLSDLFAQGATTFSAIASESPALGRGFDLAPGVLDASGRALTAVTPVLADTTRLLRAVRPGVQVLPRATRELASALSVATPVLNRTPQFTDQLSGALGSLNTLAADPLTTSFLSELSGTLTPLTETLNFINPFQTVCNYLALWGRNVPSIISEGNAQGTWFRFVPIIKADEMLQSATPSQTLHVVPYPDEGQHGQCEAGNEIYAPGQQIGPVPGAQPNFTESTSPPPGVSAP